MNKPNFNSSLQDNRSGLSRVLKDISPMPRLVLGLVCCAVIAYYLPLILITFTGIWVNNLTMIDQLLVFVVGLVTLNWIGNRFNKILLVNIIGLVAYDLYYIDFFLRTSPLSHIRYCWPSIFLITGCGLLNSLLFMWYRKVAELN